MSDLLSWPVYLITLAFVVALAVVCGIIAGVAHGIATFGGGNAALLAVPAVDALVHRATHRHACEA